MRRVNRDLGSSLFPRIKTEFDEAYSAGLPLSGVIDDLARRFQLKPEVLSAWVKQAGAVADAGEKAGYAADLVKRLTDEFNSNAAAASSSATAVVEKSKVYTEMSKKIQEQILLAGKRTEADKLAARINAGLVEGLKEGEGELLIADQKRADAAIKAAEATKKAEDSAKASAKSAAEALKKRGVDAEENYRRQIELINESANKQNKATEVAKLAFELESGKLKGVSADRQNVLKDLAAELDAKIKLQKQNENDIKLAAFSANLKDSNTIVRQGFEMELSGAGSGDRLKERLKADLEIQQDYAKQSSELFKQLNAGDISQELYDKETEMLSEALAERMVLQQDYYNQLDAAQGNWMDGMGDAWSNYLDQSRDISGQTKDMFTDAFSGMNDALYSFVTTGKLSFSDMAATAASSVLRMLIQWGTAQVAMAALNAFTSTAAIPVVGPFAAPAAAASAMGAAGSFMGMISSVAGMAHDGIDAVPEDGTWLLQKGERVTTAQTSAKLDRTLEQVAQNGGSGRNNIAIHNYAGAQVETQQDGDQLKIFIKQAKRVTSPLP